MTSISPVELLVLHAVRVLGFADTPAIAHRFELHQAETSEHLLDAEANGWVTHIAFAGTAGWSLTDRGRRENERQLAVELANTGQAEEVRNAYDAFVPLNGRVVRACTDWQLKPAPGNRASANDHTDPAWDHDVLTALEAVNQDLAPLVERLAVAYRRGLRRRFGVNSDVTASWVEAVGVNSGVSGAWGPAGVRRWGLLPGMGRA